MVQYFTTRDDLKDRRLQKNGRVLHTRDEIYNIKDECLQRGIKTTVHDGRLQGEDREQQQHAGPGGSPAWRRCSTLLDIDIDQRPTFKAYLLALPADTFQRLSCRICRQHLDFKCFFYLVSQRMIFKVNALSTDNFQRL
jgi:hypothetical protein